MREDNELEAIDYDPISTLYLKAPCKIIIEDLEDLKGFIE